MVADTHGFLLVMGHKEEGNTHVIVQAIQFNQHALTEFQVKCGKGFVQEQDLRTINQGARNRDTLTLTTRELTRLAMLKARQLYQIEILWHLFDNLRGVHTARLQAKRDVFPNGHVWEQCIILENGAHFTAVGWQIGNIHAVQDDTA